MAINRCRLLEEELLWLPEGNVLTDSQMSAINEYVIRNQVTADESEHYPEALCKGLRAVALANQAKFQVDLKGLKRDEAGGVELEYFESATLDPWKDFIESLSDLCPIFGYTGLSLGLGLKINPSDKFEINNQANVSNSVDIDIVCPRFFTDENDDDLLVL